MAEWISVEERLPKESSLVLCCGYRGGMFVGLISGRNPENKVVATSYGGKVRILTHWMPLPKPPDPPKKEAIKKPKRKRYCVVCGSEILDNGIFYCSDECRKYVKTDNTPPVQKFEIRPNKLEKLTPDQLWNYGQYQAEKMKKKMHKEMMKRK